MPNFFRILRKFFWLVCQNSTLPAHRIVFMESIYFEKKHFSICISHFRRKLFRLSAKLFHHGSRNFFGFQVLQSDLCQFFRTLRKILLAGLSELHSTCPQDCFHGKHLLWKKHTFQIIFRILDGEFSGFRQKFSSTVVRTALNSRFLIGFMPSFYRILRKNIKISLSELQSTCPQDCFHVKHLLWKKNTFQIIFRILDGDFSGFRQMFSSTVVKTALDSRFLIGILPTFFGLYAKFYRLVCRNCPLCVHRIVFMGSIFFEKKNTFQIVFRILEGDFSGFRQDISSTVVRTSLDSRFLIGIMPTFYRTLRKILLAGLSELHSTCPQDCFHGKHLLWKKHLHFSICISHFRRKLFRLSAKLFHHGSRNFIGFLVFQSDLCQFFRISRKNIMIGLSELHSTCLQDCFHVKHLLWKKTLFKLYFAFWTETFQFFGKSFPAR